MSAWGKSKTAQKQPSAGSHYGYSLGFRHCFWTGFCLASAVFGFLVSYEFMYLHLRGSLRQDVITEPDSDLDAETLMAFARQKAEDFDDRAKVKYLLEKSDNGRISIGDIVYASRNQSSQSQSLRASSSKLTVRTRTVSSSGPPGIRTRVQRNERLTSQHAWLIPLMARKLTAHMPEFFKLAKQWLGESDYNPRVMHDLVELVKMPLDSNFPSLNQTTIGKNRYESCAVVGNSGILLNASYGEQIDSHEMVIRLNNAQIFKFKEHVGSKTTISFMNSNVFRLCALRPGCWCHQYGENVAIVMYVCQANHLMLASVCGSIHRSPLIVTPSQFDTLCARIVKWYSVTNFLATTGRSIHEWDAVHHRLYFHYSSGMQAIVLALGLCDKVDIYGFGKSVDASHHYHTNQKKELTLHDYAAEYLFYDDLVHNRTIPFLSESGLPIPRVQIFY